MDATDETPSASMPADLAEAMDDLGMTSYLKDGSDAGNSPPAPRKTREEIAAKDAGSTDDDQVTRTAAIDDEAKGETPEDDEKAKALAADMDELAGIRKRTAERKRAREQRTVPAVAAKPAETPAAAKPAAQVEVPKPLNAAESEVAKAARDVIAQIAKMTADDEAAGAESKTGSEATARAADLAALKAKADAITAALGESAKLQEKFGALEEKIQAQVDRQFVLDKIEATMGDMIDDLPNLSARPGAVKEIYRAINKHYEKHGKGPNLRFALEKAEAVLARRAGADTGESQETKAPPRAEKKNHTRKTVSSSHATPPAARTNPDARTSQQVEDDLWKTLGVAANQYD